MKARTILMMVCVALLMASCDGITGKKKLKDENAALLAQLSERNSELDEMMALFNEINESFRQISAVEHRVDLQRGNIAEGSMTVRQQFASDIEFIRNQMEEQRQQIENLQNMLRTSNSKSAQLQRAVDGLTQELATKSQRIAELEEELRQKNIQIEQLTSHVANLSARNDSLAQSNQAQAQVAAEQDRIQHTAYYVYGTKKELTDQGILYKGNVLTQPGFNQNYFTSIDIRTTTTISVYAKKPKLLTTHPSGSYTLEESNSEEYILRITDPAQFWKMSKYLVIQVR